MKKLFAVISGASLLLSLGLGNVPAARAGSACTNATLTGGFGNQFTGTIREGGPGPAGPFADTGLFNFDGNGNLTASQIVSFNGTIAPFKTSGTYEVQEDCTLTLKIAGDNGAQLTASGVIVNLGTEMMIIETNPLTVTTGILKKADSTCTNATLTDGFGIQVAGTLLEDAPRPAGPFAGNGLLNFDGNGNLTTSLTISLNGAIGSFKGSGTYNVEEDCTLTAKFTDELSGTPISISGVIVKRGTEILIIQTDPNRVVTGTVKKVD